MNVEDLEWSEIRCGWTATLESPLLMQASLFIDTSGPEEWISEIQHRALEQINDLDASFAAAIDRMLRDWVSQEWEHEDQQELEEDDFEWHIDAVEIPWIREVGKTYFMLCLSCELDPEHGVGIACRNGKDFAICHPETFHNLRVDDRATLELPFLSKQEGEVEP